MQKDLLDRKNLPIAAPEPVESWWPLLVEWLLIGVAAPLLFLPSLWWLGGVFLILVAWWWRYRAYGVWRSRTGADPALLLILLTALMGWLVAVDSSASRERAMWLLLSWVLYEATLFSLAKVGIKRSIFVLAGLAALLLAGVSLSVTNFSVGVLVPLPSFYETLSRLVSHSRLANDYQGIVNPRTIAAVALLFWPMNAFLAISRTKLSRWQRVLHVVAALALLLVMLLTQSPQALLAIVAAIGVFWLWSEKRHVQVPSRRKLAIAMGALVGFLFGLLLFARVLPTSFWATLFSGRFGFAFVARLELWVRAWRMIQSAPLTGIGLDNYAAIMDQFYLGYVLGPEPHAHQLYLQTMTDQGILGLFGLLLLFGVVSWTTIRLLQTQDDAFLKLVLVTILATIVAWLLFGLSEVQPEAGVLMWLLLAVPMGMAQRQKLHTNPGKWSLFALGMVLFTLVLLWQQGMLRYNMAIITAQQALSERATIQQDPTIALQRLQAAEYRLGPQAHLYRLRALLQMQEGHHRPTSRTFRQLFALESSQPLWWVAPAPVITGELHKGPEADGLRSIYWHWYVRYPERIEPVVLLAYGYMDGLKDKRTALKFLNEAVDRGHMGQRLFKTMINELTDE